MKIVAVDSEKKALDSLESAIRSAEPDAEVAFFCDCTLALKYVEQKGADAVFTEAIDGGIEFASRLKALKPGLNVIFVTNSAEYAHTAFGMHASGYIIKPATADAVKRELCDLRYPVNVAKKLRILTFGNFEVLCDGEPLIFKYRKSKEMLAYLVDRRGAMCSTGELVGVLFEDGGNHMPYYHRIRADMLDTLKSCGCESAVTSQRGLLGVCVDEIECDYYSFLEGNATPSQLYRGEYMSQYSFAEVTNATLFTKQNKH